MNKKEKNSFLIWCIFKYIVRALPPLQNFTILFFHIQLNADVHELNAGAQERPNHFYYYLQVWEVSKQN